MAPIRNPKPFLNALLKLRLLPEAHELVQGTLVSYREKLNDVRRNKPHEEKRLESFLQTYTSKTVSCFAIVEDETERCHKCQRDPSHPHCLFLLEGVKQDSKEAIEAIRAGATATVDAGTLICLEGCSKCRTFKHGCKLLPQPERPARKANKGKQVRGIGNREQQPVPAPAAKVDDHLEFNLDHLAFQVLAEPAALLPGLEPRLADDDNFDFQPELDPGVVDHILALPLGMETVAVPFEYVDDHPPEQQPTLDIATVEQQSSLDIASFEQLMEFLGQYTDQEPVAGGDDYVNNLEGLAPALPEFVPNAAVVDPRPPQFGQPAAPPHFPPWAGPAFPAPVRITGVLANSVHPDCGHWF